MEQLEGIHSEHFVEDSQPLDSFDTEDISTRDITKNVETSHFLSKINFRQIIFLCL